MRRARRRRCCLRQSSEPGGTAKRARERGDGRLAVRAGDRDHFLLGRQLAREELDVAGELRALRHRGRNRWMILGHAGTDRHEIRAFEGRSREWPRDDAHSRQCGSELCRERRRRPSVRDTHVGTSCREMPGERVPGEPEPEHDGVASRIIHRARPSFIYRSFSVERPKRTSSIVMIQKRTTTWFSFQPLSS